MSLSDKKCVPCEGGAPALKGQAIQDFLKQLTTPWQLIDEQTISQQFKFKDFKEALAFVNKVGEIAESEGHHPDIHLTGWNKVTIELSTHFLGGLSENDFIVASKIETLIAK